SVAAADASEATPAIIASSVQQKLRIHRVILPTSQNRMMRLDRTGRGQRRCRPDGPPCQLGEN
ncbi:MAG: hypothetical protein KDI80_05555, partial [Xanthomonadales bacterium]|nr:hypothetical protein [Xanthomonadales bacterium]